MLFTKDTLKSFAASKGIDNIEEESYRILSQDLEYRIKEVCQEAAKFMTASHRTKLNINDINNALISRNVEPLFGYESQEVLLFRGLPCNAYHVPDEEIDLEEYLERPLPKIPLKPYIQSHWLAIEGVQPPIQQNPIIIDKPTVKNDNISNYQEEMVVIKQIKHRLTKELNMYFEKILQVMETDPSISMDCLSNETGIQQLVPYFIYHFNNELRNDIKNSEKAKTLCLMYFSLLKNKFIFIDPYLHEILPSLLTCVVGKSPTDDVRNTAIDVLKFLHSTFSYKYKTLAPRMISTLKKSLLNKEKAVECRKAAAKCLSILSPEIAKNHIVPHISEFKNEELRRYCLELVTKMDI
ncbi:TFIID 70K subfamily [Nucleospora cyclopteri]